MIVTFAETTREIQRAGFNLLQLVATPQRPSTGHTDVARFRLRLSRWQEHRVTLKWSKYSVISSAQSLRFILVPFEYEV